MNNPKCMKHTFKGHGHLHKTNVTLCDPTTSVMALDFSVGDYFINL